MLSRMRTDGEGQPMAIHNRKDFHAFPAFREAHGIATPLVAANIASMKLSVFIKRSLFAQRIGQLGENLPKDLVLAPLLKPAMDGFVVRIALRQQMPLGAGVQNPVHRLQHRLCRDGFAARLTVRDVFFRNMLANPAPVVITWTLHGRCYAYGYSWC